MYKVFGNHVKQALSLADQGKSKQEILQKTGAVIGIHGAEFAIHKREIFVVMGLSGSGKSTLIRCLNRLIEPSRGEVLIDGHNILTMSNKQLNQVRRSKISMVFQNFGLFPHRNVLSNVEYGLEVSGVNKETRKAKAQTALSLVGLKDYEASYPGELSGGMQQRVGLARALANDPEILLMDEAFSALDPLIRTEMQDELLELQAKMHKTIVFITHDLDEALKLGDRIAIMKNGRVVQVGTPEEILTDPADDYVASFVQQVDRSKVITAGSIMTKAPSMTLPQSGSRVAVRMMEKHKTTHLFVVDNNRRLKGLLTMEDCLSLDRAKISSVDSKLRRDILVASGDTAISDLLGSVLESEYPLAVTDEEGRFLGQVDRASVLAEVVESDNSEGPTTLAEYHQTLMTREPRRAE
ncbi:quaternary amine ABC transporter ATP-binding protein [Dongshaea marina]|uniref:quaternary amine ABC transporter ATP-binding protein n=1 Tax=Dongshaea marina TaxID=2047966 RepID=UPI002D77BA8F|nr:glycine betaine/L-proline ABC transporter ATP-binding protein [Dongshaea marina]